MRSLSSVVGDAAQRHDVALAVQRLGDVLGRDLAEGGVVAGHVGVLRAGVGQAAVDHRDVDALGLDLRHRLGQRRRFEREDDQRVDLGHGRQVLQLVGLLGRVGGGLDRDLQVLVLLLEILLGLVGPVVDAAHEAVRGGRDRHAEIDRLGGRQRREGRDARGGDGAERQASGDGMSCCLSPVVNRKWNGRESESDPQRAALQEGDDDDHEALHRGVQVHADDAGEVQDVADDREQDRRRSRCP